MHDSYHHRQYQGIHVSYLLPSAVDCRLPLVAICHFLQLALLHVLHTRNNTDGNKLVIFSCIALYYGDNYILTVADCINAIITPTNLVQRLWCIDPHGLLCNAGEGGPRTVAVREGEEDVFWFNVQVHQGHGVDVLQTLQNRTTDIATLFPLLTDHITRELEDHDNIFSLKVKVMSTYS